MKKFLSFILLAIVALCLVACGETEDVEALAKEYLGKISITYAEGDSESSVTQDITLGTLSVENVTVGWTSQNGDVISTTGKVTRSEKDETVKLTVEVTYKDAKASKDFNLTVKAKEVEIVKPLNIEISGDKKMSLGETYQLTATVKPDDAQDKSVTWSSNNESVATVDQTGKVTAIKAGSAVIIATSNADAKVRGTYTITVQGPQADSIAKVLAKEKGAEGWVKGTVVGVYAQGYYLYDGTGYILVYLGKDATFDQKIGDYVEVKGILDNYNGANQFTSSATITPLTEGTDYKLNATTMKEAQVLALMANVEVCKKIKVSFIVTSVSSSYVNGTIVDGTTPISICYPVDSSIYEVGVDYELTCLALYAKEYQSVNTLYVMAEKATKIDHGYDVHITYQDGDNKDIVTINSLEFPIELKTPEAKEGKVFLGWYKGTEEKPIKVTTILAPEDTTIFARWCNEEDAPIVVNPEAEEGSGQYKTISDALAVAEEGATIELLAGEYSEDYITLVERTYKDLAAVAKDFVKDFASNSGKSIDAGDEMDTAYIDSVDLTNFWANAEMKTKWAWLFKAIYEVAEYPENCDPDSADFSDATVKSFFISNLCGLFTGTIHTDSKLKTVSYNWANTAKQKLVFSYCDKADPTAEDILTAQIIIDKKVNIIGPNMNVHGHSEDRNEEANIICKFVVAADGVTLNGLKFSVDGILELNQCKNVTIDNCYHETDTYGNTGVNNRKAVIYNNGYTENIIIRNTCVIFAGSSYQNVAIDFDSDGITNFTLDNCYIENTTSTAAIYECFMAYTVRGVFNFINNEFHYGGDGYVIRLGFTECTCSEINIIDNKFLPLGDIETSTIGIHSMDAKNGLTINVIGNEFENFYPNTFKFEGALAEGAVVNYLYNYFDNKQQWKIPSLNDVTFNHDYNCTLGKVASDSALDIKDEAHTFATKEELDAAYALYKASLKTVTFDTDGGYEIYPISFVDYKSVVLPTPVKDNFDFLGWYVGDVKYTELSENADITLTAKWGKLYTITFDTDGGSELDPLNYTSLKGLVLPTPTKDGFILEGWYDGEKKVTEITEFGNYTLKAKWAIPFVITFDTDGGKELDTAYYLDYASYTLPTPVKDGYYFLGWYDGENKVEALSANANLNLKASWREVKHLVVNAGVSESGVYSTIQAAIDAASDGDIIVVGAGEYDTFVVDKNDLTIEGVGEYKIASHASDFTPLKETHTLIDGFAATGVKGLTIKNLTITDTVTLSNLKDFTVDTVYQTGGMYDISGDNSNYVFDHLYYAGSAARIIYVKSGTMDSMTVDYLIVMDKALVTMDGTTGKYADGICDAIRFGEATAAKVGKGNFVLTNSYIRAGQSGFMDRFPNCDSYVIENNYFYQVPASIYFRAATLTNAIDYSICYNTFVGCGNSMNDWDVLVVTTSDATTVKVNYNAFINSFPFVGTDIDYVIKIRTNAGEINCAKNYYNVDSDFENALNATASTRLVIDENEKIPADKEYERYAILNYKGTIVIYGLNFILKEANVKLDDNEATKVVIATYTLPTPEKDGYEFAGWFDGEAQVTEITEEKDYNLESKWNKLSIYNNMEGATMTYINREVFIQEFLKDLNEFKGTKYRVETLPTGAWTLVGLDTFFLSEKYSAKYLPFIKFIAENSNTESSCAGEVLKLYQGLTGANESGVAKTVEDLINNYEYTTSKSTYALQYEVLGWIFGIQHTANSSFYSADYSQDALKYGLSAYYQPTKEGYTFDGWYLDAEFNTPVTGELSKYDQVYYAKWTAVTPA